MIGIIVARGRRASRLRRKDIGARRLQGFASRKGTGELRPVRRMTRAHEIPLTMNYADGLSPSAGELQLDVLRKLLPERWVKGNCLPQQRPGGDNPSRVVEQQAEVVCAVDVFGLQLEQRLVLRDCR